jgi:hypothetical protein
VRQQARLERNPWLLKLGGARADTRWVSSEPSIASVELPLTFPAEDGSTIVNFGLITGREATQAEIDRLAQLLSSEAQAGPDITIVSSRRQDYDEFKRRRPGRAKLRSLEKIALRSDTLGLVCGSS